MKCPKCERPNPIASKTSRMTPRGSECVTNHFHCDDCDLDYQNVKYKDYHKAGHPRGRRCIQTW
jgi:C4-type Zn-finger protein